jgi:anthranilate/para-aminobenzoate synthase component I
VGYFSRWVERTSPQAGSSVASPHQAGGGWVSDSEPEAEFQETENKTKPMLKAVALAETFTRA